VNQMFTKLLILPGLCLALSPAYASSLSPGGTVTPTAYGYGTPAFPSGAPDGVSSVGANNLLQEGESWALANSRTSLANITFENAVYVDPTTGDLDFFYQIQNTYNGATTASNTVSKTVVLNESFEGTTITGVAEITSANFKGFDDYVKPTAGDAITSVSLGSYQADGSANLTINFSTPITPKTDSAILVIETNSTDFDQAGQGTFSWTGNPPAGAHDGSNLATNPFTLDALEPIPTPEPGFYGVLSLGLAGLLLLVHRRSGKVKANSNDVNA